MPGSARRTPGKSIATGPWRPGAGRRVEVVNRRGLVEVSELTRGRAVIRTARFLPSRVIALVEHPAPRGARRESTGSRAGGARGASETKT
jgi:hypothetical protein